MKLPRFVPRIEQTLLLLVVPILAIAALSLSSRAHSTVAPIRAAAAVARAKLTPGTTTTVAPDPAGGAALPTASTPVAEELPQGGGTGSSPESASLGRALTATPSGAPAAVVAATALPGEQPAPTVSESQSPIFLVLVALMVIAIAVLLWWRAARRRERTGVTP